MKRIKLWAGMTALLLIFAACTTGEDGAAATTRPRPKNSRQGVAASLT